MVVVTAEVVVVVVPVVVVVCRGWWCEVSDEDMGLNGVAEFFSNDWKAPEWGVRRLGVFGVGVDN